MSVSQILHLGLASCAMEPTTQYADLDALEEYEAGLPARWVECRDTGHTWRKLDANPLPDGGWVRVHRCPCKSERTQELDRYGRVVSSHIEYPEGYLLPKGTGRIDSDGKGVFRLASIHRDAAKVAKVDAKPAAKRTAKARSSH